MSACSEDLEPLKHNVAISNYNEALNFAERLYNRYKVSSVADVIININTYMDLQEG